ncbi:hypothetical protein [Gryllotalpicola ginsengisoli]|uniref:hypothetical protein n=1 Tax=Gryllotalpicola ginsengisoli TaxID=444608 RepID=UPI0005242B89|nr:hypothetical protein [Gryllotalpicola ginsengisoli]
MPAHRRHVFHARVGLAAGTDRLVPLSELAHLDPAAHDAALAKYDDTPERQRLRDTVIPIIGRRWTEVVFLSPVHPHAIWQAWRELTGQELAPLPFWAIPVAALPTETVVFTRARSAVGDPIHPDEVTALDKGSFRTALQTTPENRDWLASLAARGAKGAWFNGTPHVLAGGDVSLRDAQTISWEEPFAATL